jgi:hypothetical protein
MTEGVLCLGSCVSLSSLRGINAGVGHPCLFFGMGTSMSLVERMMVSFPLMGGSQRLEGVIGSHVNNLEVLDLWKFK